MLAACLLWMYRTRRVNGVQRELSSPDRDPEGVCGRGTCLAQFRTFTELGSTVEAADVWPPCFAPVHFGHLIGPASTFGVGPDVCEHRLKWLVRGLASVVVVKYVVLRAIYAYDVQCA